MDFYTLKRIAYLPSGTFGRLTIGNETFYTVERPWLGNKSNVSCIPEGIYRCKRYSSKKYPDTFEITDVRGRTYILFHAANYPDDVQGCIGLGLDIDFGPMVSDSKKAVSKFMRLLEPIDEFDLEITQYRPEYP